MRRVPILTVHQGVQNNNDSLKVGVKKKRLIEKSLETKMFLTRQSFLLICIALAIIEQSNGSSEEDSSSKSTENEDKLVPTYRTPIEVILQGLVGAIGSTGRSSEGDGNGIGGFLDKVVRKPIKKVLEPVEKVTVKGFGDLLNLFEDRFHAIFPGTMWCGAGNIASGEDDVGRFADTDQCCRAHDMCPHNIEAGKSLGPLLNNGGFTRSACSCDHQFYNCLKDVNSPISINIGVTYFNVLRPQCFAIEYPIEKCAQHGRNRLLERKCIKYDLDSSQNKTLEWFDNPDF